jgi:hypothetical protein
MLINLDNVIILKSVLGHKNTFYDKNGNTGQQYGEILLS